MSTASATENTVQFSHAIPILCVNDVPASLRYYADALGFDQVWAWSDQKESFDEGHATFACVCRGGVTIFLCEQGQGQPGAWMSIFLDDLESFDAVHREYLKSGANIVAGPTDEPWGMREMHVQDLDGNTFRIGAELSNNGNG